jgi:hypothetical protein
MARQHTKTFDDHHRVMVTVTRQDVEIEATWIDPEEGENAVVERLSLSRDELAWIVGKVIEA